MVHAKTAAAERLHRQRQSASQRARWAKNRERLRETRRRQWARLTPEQREARLAPLREGYEADKERIRKETSRRQRARAAEISEASRQMWARRTPEERAELAEKLRTAWASKSPTERQQLIKYRAERRRERWEEQSPTERLEFGRRVSEGHAQRRAEGRGYGPYPARAPRPRIREEAPPAARRVNTVNELARRMAAEAAMPADVALTVASVAMGVGPS